MSTRFPLRTALALCLSGAALALAAAPASADVRKDFFSFNACGNVCNDGELGVTHAILNSIEDRSRPQPDAVMLQEMCFNQYDHLRWHLENHDQWRMEGRFIEVRDDVANCGSTGRFGNAVFVRGGVNEIDDTDYVPFDAQDGGAETRKMICARVTWQRSVRVCSTHLENTNAQCGDQSCRWKQARQIKQKTQGYLDNGVPVVVGGDFNARPDWDTMDHMYAQWLFGGRATGNFEEVDQSANVCRCGAVTWESNTTDDRAKFDYIFVSGRNWESIGGGPTGSPYSDHHPLLGHATLHTP